MNWLSKMPDTRTNKIGVGNRMPESEINEKWRFKSRGQRAIRWNHRAVSMTQSHCRTRRASEVNTAGKARLKRKRRQNYCRKWYRQKKICPNQRAKASKEAMLWKPLQPAQSLPKEPTFPLYPVTGNYIYIRFGSYMFMGSLSSHPSLSTPGCKSG